MTIADLLCADGVIARLRVGAKKQALVELARKAAGLTGLDERMLLGVLCDREQAGSTGVGSGVAIPHGKLAGLERPVGLFARLERPIDFEAIDNRPVDLIFLLLMPQGATAAHLKTLARISRLMRDHGLCDKLRGTERADALYLLLIEGPASDAA